MKTEYGVQCLWEYNNGESEWELWGQHPFDTLDEAREELKRGIVLASKQEFRIVKREVTEWEQMEEVKQ